MLENITTIIIYSYLLFTCVMLFYSAYSPDFGTVNEFNIKILFGDNCFILLIHTQVD